MERLFLDTNILLDFVLDRTPFAEYADRILQLKITQKKKIFASALSVANVAYFVRKVGKDPVMVIKDLMEWVQVVSLTEAEFNYAVKSTFKDSEDALQFFSAQQIDADVIITRDVKGFVSSSIPVQSPAQFLKSVSK